MKKTSVAMVLAGVCLLLNGCVDDTTTDNDIWQTNYSEALQQAQAENKYILMDFSGSDWCGWCIKLNDDVFSQEAFISYAKENLIPVMIDFPRIKEQSDEEAAQNKELATKYQVEGFPTVLILNPKGELVARTGYLPGNSATYVEHIQSLIESDK